MMFIFKDLNKNIYTRSFLKQRLPELQQIFLLNLRIYKFIYVVSKKMPIFIDSSNPSYPGLFYDAIQNEIGAEMAYMEANKLNQSAAVAMARAIREEELARERRERAEGEEAESDGHKGETGNI